MSNDICVSRDSSDGAQGISMYNPANSYAAASLTGVPVLPGPTKHIAIDYKQNLVGVTAGSSTAQLWHYDYASTTGATYTTPMGIALDGNGNIFWPDHEATGQVFMMNPSGTGGGSVTNGTLTSFFPCFVYNGQCSNGSSWLRGMAIDSAGTMWYLGNNSNYAVVQTFGLAAPAWPLLSYAQAGVPVQ